jgi:SnoaL-like polyketide cyclase
MSETRAIQTMEALAKQDALYVKNNTAENATASGGVFPMPVPLAVAMVVMDTLWTALPDFHIEINSVETLGDESVVAFMWGGTHTGWLELPDTTPVPPTGKSVWVRDAFVFRFAEGKIKSVRIASPDGGGIPGLLAQLAITIA